MIDFIVFRNTFLAALFAVCVALFMLPGCSSTDESSDSGGTEPTKDEICDEADAGSTGCPEIR